MYFARSKFKPMVDIVSASDSTYHRPMNIKMLFPDGLMLVLSFIALVLIVIAVIAAITWRLSATRKLGNTARRSSRRPHLRWRCPSLSGGQLLTRIGRSTGPHVTPRMAQLPLLATTLLDPPLLDWPSNFAREAMAGESTASSTARKWLGACTGYGTHAPVLLVSISLLPVPRVFKALSRLFARFCGLTFQTMRVKKCDLNFLHHQSH
jgi:hypothetical protein